MLVAVQNSLARNEEIKKFGTKLGSLDMADRKMILEGANIFRSLCATCHGSDGKGLPSKIAPPLVGNFRRLIGQKDTTIMILLHGLTGPVNGKTYPVDMPSMGSNNDQWIASVLSYLRYDLGITNRSSGPMSPQFLSRILVKPEEVKKIRAQTVGRNKPWTMAELEKAGK
jgi:mono/diheme cytochrome c family protein